MRDGRPLSHTIVINLLRGKTVSLQRNHIDTGMFAVDRRLVGDQKWVISEYGADGESAPYKFMWGIRSLGKTITAA